MGRPTSNGKEIPGFASLSRHGLHEGYHRDTSSDASRSCAPRIRVSQFLGNLGFFLSFCFSLLFSPNGGTKG